VTWDKMKILIACECSGIVRDAFLALGHDAWSCDLKPTRRPGPHIQGDAREVIAGAWDMMIAHPVCKRLTNAGVRWLHERPGYWEDMVAGAEFFKLFDQAHHIPKRAVENPIMHKYAREIIGRGADQYVQPHWFGDPFQKATGFHLTGLPKLKRTHWPKHYPPGTEFKQECWLMSPGPDREEKRSNTYPAIARAMAEQWGQESPSIVPAQASRELTSQSSGLRE
jgi:hypothetical protein